MTSIKDKFLNKLTRWGVLILIIYVPLLLLGIFALNSSTLIRSNINEIDTIAKTDLINISSLVLMIIGGLLIIVGLIYVISVRQLDKCLVLFTILIFVNACCTWS